MTRRRTAVVPPPGSASADSQCSPGLVCDHATSTCSALGGNGAACSTAPALSALDGGVVAKRRGGPQEPAGPYENVD